MTPDAVADLLLSSIRQRLLSAAEVRPADLAASVEAALADLDATLPGELADCLLGESRADDHAEKARLMAEILAHTLDPAALEDLLKELRYSADQPRIPAGQPGAGQFAGGATASASNEAGAKVRELIKGGSGGLSKEKGLEMMGHMAKMTVAHLTALKKELGLKAGAPSKAELVNTLATRIQQHLQATAPEKAPEPKTPKVKAPRPNPEPKPAVPRITAAAGTREEMAQQIAAHPDETMKSVVARLLKERSAPVGDVGIHGMTHPEAMRGVTIDGTHFKWPEGQEEHIAEGLAYLMTKKIPEKLWEATGTVVFSTQSNADDPHWQKVYNNPHHRSHATGGDGKICVYSHADTGLHMPGMEAEPSGTRAGSIGPQSYAHESGHNLATQTWGSTAPDPGSGYGRAQKEEPPVSQYGANSPAEDFAEACAHMASQTGRERLRTQYPKKYAALSKMLGET